MKLALKICNIIFALAFTVTFIVSIIAVCSLDAIPLKYIIYYGIIFLVLLTVNILSLIFKSRILKISALVISLIMIVLHSFVIYYVDKTNGFIKNLYNDEQTEIYYLATLKDSEYKDITDLKDKKIGTFYNNEATYKSAIKIINSKVQAEVINNPDLIELCDLLLNESLDAILVSENGKKLIEEENELISLQIKYIYNVTTKTRIENIAKDIDVVKKPFVLYISGIDSYGDIKSVSRSDVNIVAVINPNTKKILLVTIPRDYYVTLASFNQKDKLTHAGLYGIGESVKTIEKLLDIDINFYLRINFSTLVNAIDTIGGVNVYSEYTFNTYGTQFYKGYNKCDGTKALAFARARYNFAGGDRTRGQNQLRVIEAIINKMASSRVLVTNYLDILNALDKKFETNIDYNRIYDLVKFQLYYNPDWSIEQVSLNGIDSSNVTYSFGKQKLYVMEPIISTITNAKNKIKELTR